MIQQLEATLVNLDENNNPTRMKKWSRATRICKNSSKQSTPLIGITFHQKSIVIEF
jgi:hypothetical protein